MRPGRTWNVPILDYDKIYIEERIFKDGTTEYDIIFKATRSDGKIYTVIAPFAAKCEAESELHAIGCAIQKYKQQEYDVKYKRERLD